MSTSQRLLTLLSLLQSGRDWTGNDLAQRLDVSGRTIRKEIERLRGLGYPVEAARGMVGGYRLGAGAELPPLLLDDDEAVAIAVSLTVSAEGGIAGIEDASLRALTKLRQVLPTRLRRRVDALRGFISRVELHEGGPAVDSETLALIANACRDGERLRISYRRHDATASRRIIEPHRLVNWGNRWYLVAWDGERDDWRTFRVDRIDRVEPTARRFRPRPLPAEPITDYIARTVAQAGWRYGARIRVDAPAAVVEQSINLAVGIVTPIDDDHCLLQTGSDDLWTIAVYISVLNHDFTIEHPPELIDYLQVIADRYRRAIEQSQAPAESGVTASRTVGSPAR